MERSNKNQASVEVEKGHSVRKITRKELLIRFRNNTLNQLVSHEINIKVLEDMDPKKKMGERNAGVTKEGRPIMLEVFAKDRLTDEREKLEESTALLKAIDDLLAKEE